MYRWWWGCGNGSRNNKLKLYNHSKESRAELEQDLAETLSSLEALGEALAISLFGKLTNGGVVEDSVENAKLKLQVVDVLTIEKTKVFHDNSNSKAEVQ